jgi:hypothetical protein
VGQCGAVPADRNHTGSRLTLWNREVLTLPALMVPISFSSRLCSCSIVVMKANARAKTCGSLAFGVFPFDEDRSLHIRCPPCSCIGLIGSSWAASRGTGRVRWMRGSQTSAISVDAPESHSSSSNGGKNKKKAGRLLDGRTWDEMPESLAPSEGSGPHVRSLPVIETHQRMRFTTPCSCIARSGSCSVGWRVQSAAGCCTAAALVSSGSVGMSSRPNSARS